MTYFEGFLVPVPESRREEYRKHAADAAPLFHEFGGKAVDARPDEKVVFSWFEYPDKAARDAANEKMTNDPRMKEMGASMPFDGKRMIFGGFEAIVEEGSSKGGYTDGFVVPVPERKKDAYRELASKMAKVFRQHGANRIVEAIADDISHGQVTDFYRAVKAEDGETVVFSFIEWPDKQTRDDAWAKIMNDESMKPEGEMPFSGQRMFWGGFDPIVDSEPARQRETA